MANQVKLNSNRSETKNEKLKRNKALKKVINSDKSGLKPSKSLNKFGRIMFKSIIQNNKQLNSSDSFSLNMLCANYELYLKMNDYIIKNGPITSDGKKAPQFSVLKQTEDVIFKISNQLNITPKNRITNDFKHAQDQEKKEDPVRKALED